MGLAVIRSRVIPKRAEKFWRGIGDTTKPNLTMMRFQLGLLAFSALVGSASASGAVELDLDNFESKISGKNAFVKFLAPW